MRRARAGPVIEGTNAKTPNREIEGLTKSKLHESLELVIAEVESAKWLEKSSSSKSQSTGSGRETNTRATQKL